MGEISEWVGIVRDIFVGGSAATAAYFAYQGLDTWRRELKGRSEYQLAKDVFKALYRVREAFKIVRNPEIFSYEYPEEMRNFHGYLKREHDFDGTMHVYNERLKHLNKAFLELEDLHLHAQVEWGPEFQDRIVKLRECRSDLFTVIDIMLDRKKNPQDRGMIDAEKMKKEKLVLYNMGRESEYGQFTRKIEDAIQEFETWLRPKIAH